MRRFITNSFCKNIFFYNFIPLEDISILRDKLCLLENIEYLYYV